MYIHLFYSPQATYTFFLIYNEVNKVEHAYICGKKAELVWIVILSYMVNNESCGMDILPFHWFVDCQSEVFKEITVWENAVKLKSKS